MDRLLFVNFLSLSPLLEVALKRLLRCCDCLLDQLHLLCQHLSQVLVRGRVRKDAGQLDFLLVEGRHEESADDIRLALVKAVDSSQYRVPELLLTHILHA